MESIDVEEQNILTAIFKDSFPESWQNDPNFVHYLSELSSYGVEKLAQEPDRLAEEKAQILEDTQTLAFHNYKTFIQTAECSRDIFEDFQIIENHVEQLLTKLPEFSEHCNTVLKKAQEISSSRRMNSVTLQRHTQLLEILELPQLMDTCVRNGYYDEALELAAHVKRLEKKHAAIPVIATIVNEVKLSTQLMLNQLIQQLRTNVQLPACLRVIGYLRRMDVFTEAELRIKFLQARDAWFQGILATIPKEDAYTHINKTIEASRVNLFDIITQYRAIFSDEDPLLSTTKGNTLNEAALFHGWIVQKVSQFLSVLETDLQRGVGGRLDSILGQCMYFGLSFSRVGADFRGLLTPIFQRAALDGLKSALAEANKRFEENMRTYSLLSSTSSMGGSQFNPASQSGQMYPPTVLLDFHPLAEYCNDLLTALNELRLCAPLALVTEVANCLHDSFIVVNKVIQAFKRAEETTFDHKERERFKQFCAAYGLSLVPYINRCLQALFPPAQLAQILGVTVSEIHKMGNLGQVDVDSALALVKDLIPEAETVEPPSVDTSYDFGKPSLQFSKPDTPVISADTISSKPLESKPAIIPEVQITVSEPFIQQDQIQSEKPVITDKAAEPVETVIHSSENTETETSENALTASDNAEVADRLNADSIKFSLGDTDDETDLDKQTVALGDNTQADGDDGDGQFDIESDLSALAADVLGTKPKEDDLKKKAD